MPKVKETHTQIGDQQSGEGRKQTVTTELSMGQHTSCLNSYVHGLKEATSQVIAEKFDERMVSNVKLTLAKDTSKDHVSAAENAQPQTTAEPISANAYKIYVSVSDMKHAQPQAPSSGNVVRDVLNSGNVSELASVQEA